MLLLALLIPMPAAAGAQAGPPAPPPNATIDADEFRVMQRCQRPKDREDIVVCGRRRPRSPFRIPLETQHFDPDGDEDSVSRERHGLYEQGDAGTGSCSTVGPGGHTGCTMKRFKRDNEQRAGSRNKALIERVTTIGDEPEEVE